MKTLATALLILIATTATAAQCPSIQEVLIHGQWQAPKAWQVFKLSPLANDTGQKTVVHQGLMHVFYLKSTQQLRCVYNKIGEGVAQNTYILTQTLESFTPLVKKHWPAMMGNVLSCTLISQQTKPNRIKPKDCQWR